MSWEAIAEEIVDFGTRLGGLEERLAFLTARHNRVTEPIAARLDALERRVAELERLSAELELQSLVIPMRGEWVQPDRNTATLYDVEITQFQEGG